MAVDQIPIGRFSLITRLSQKALRHYDRKGLLVPEAKDIITGYRYYTGAQIDKGIKIKALASLGFGLEDIAAMLEAKARGDDETLDTVIERHLARTREEIERLREIESLLDNRTEELKKMTLTEPTIKEVPRMRALSKRERGTYGETIPKLIGELMKELFSPDNQRNLVKMNGALMTLYHDHEYKDEDADIEVAIPVTGKVSIHDPDIEVRNISGAKVLSLVHRGPYETVGVGWTKLHEHMVAEGLEIVGPIRELYLNDPNDTPQDELMTELQAPIED